MKSDTLRIVLHTKPLSVNEAWQGRRFSTPAKKAFELALSYALPPRAVPPGPYYSVAYDFYLTNFAMTDGANLEKVLTDCLVKRGILTDDRYIIDYRIRKFPAKQDRIEIVVEPAALNKE